MNTSENYLGDTIFGVHAYKDMPASFEMPWDSIFIDLSESAVYVICGFDEPLGIRRYDGYLVNPQWKKMDAINQAFVVPEVILTAQDQKTKETLLATIDFSVAMMGARLFQGGKVKVRPGGHWVGVTPFRGAQLVDNTTAARAYINLADLIKSKISHGVISIVDSGIDSEACGDDLERTPSKNDAESFWRARGLDFFGGYAGGLITGHAG